MRGGAVDDSYGLPPQQERGDACRTNFSTWQEVSESITQMLYPDDLTKVAQRCTYDESGTRFTAHVA
jgi:hypothetical protein